MTIPELIDRAKLLRLEGVEILNAYKLKEIKQIYNGIGPDNFPGWLRRAITNSAGLLEPAALIHDLDFHCGGTEEDYKRANDRFEKNCKTLVKDRYGWYNPFRYLWLNKARRWANYCRVFGRTSFKFKEAS